MSTVHRDAPPFRADRIGSLLRRHRLLQAREQFNAGRTGARELVAHPALGGREEYHRPTLEA